MLSTSQLTETLAKYEPVQQSLGEPITTFAALGLTCFILALCVPPNKEFVRAASLVSGAMCWGLTIALLALWVAQQHSCN